MTPQRQSHCLQPTADDPDLLRFGSTINQFSNALGHPPRLRLRVRGLRQFDMGCQGVSRVGHMIEMGHPLFEPSKKRPAEIVTRGRRWVRRAVENHRSSQHPDHRD